MTEPAGGGTRIMPADLQSVPPRTAGPVQPLDASPRSANQAGPVGAYPGSASPSPGYPMTPPGQPGAYGPTPGPPTGPPASTKAERPKRRLVRVLVTILVLVIAWPVGLGLWANSRLQHIEALSDKPSTSGRTYLIAGSDARGTGGVADPTEGARTDTIMLVHMATNGQASLVSIPRDTYAQIPGHGGNKINAAYAFGGPRLLVLTVEELTGFKIDHYLELGFGSVTDLVDAVGGVELCLDKDVSDRLSKLEWTAGCHLSDGEVALAFSRMRYADPLGDLGRVERQRQVLGQVMKRSVTPAVFLWPPRQVSLVNAGSNALVVDESMNILSLIRLMLDFRKATGLDGVMGTPPIASTNFEPGGIGSAVLLDEAGAAQTWRDIEQGTWVPVLPSL